MPWFSYEALTQGGHLMTGQLEAPATQAAHGELEALGLDVRSIDAVAAGPARRADLSADDLIFFNEQLASLADAGIALDEGLAQLASDISSPRLRRWLDGLVDDLRRGVALDVAVANRDADLPVLYSQVIRAGIASGRLPESLFNLNQHLRFIASTRRMIWEAISYPLLVAVFALLVVGFFFGYLVPHFTEIYGDFGMSLPVLTQLLVDIGAHFPALMIAFAALVVLGVIGWRALRSRPWGRTLRDRFVLTLPIFGNLYRASLSARFLRSMATSLASEMPLPMALRISALATGSAGLTADAEQLAGEVERGNSIFVASRSSRWIPPLFGYCVEVARGRDALPNAVARLARAYEARAQLARNTLQSLLFPVLVLFLGGLIALGILGVFLPLVNLVNSMSG